MGSIHFDITASDAQLTSTINHAQNELDKFIQKQRQNSKEFIELFANMGATSEMKEAYEELAMWADRSFTSQSESIRGLEMSLHESQLSLKTVGDMMSDLTRRYKEGQMVEEEYVDAMARLDVLYRDISRSIGEVSSELQRQISSEQMAEGSIESLRAKISLLTVEYQKLSAEERNSDIGKNLLEQMKETSVALSEATREMSTYGAETIDTYSRIDGLVTRLGSSLPTLLRSPMSLLSQMPSIIQNVEKAQEEYQKMMDAGQDSEPVWKQLVGAAFSWQTALVALVPIIIANKDAIYEWLYTLSTGKSILADYNHAMKAVNEAYEQQIGSVASDMTSLKKLTTQWSELTDDESKKKWLKENENAFRQLGFAIDNTAKAEEIFGSAENTEKLVQAFTARAKAAAIAQVMQEQYAKSLSLQLKADEKDRKANAVGDIEITDNMNETDLFKLAQQQIRKKRAERLRKNAAREEEGVETLAQMLTESEQLVDSIFESLGISLTSSDPDDNRTSREAARNLVTAFLKATNDQLREAGENQLESPVAILTYNYSTQLNKLKEDLDKAMAEASPEEQKALQDAYEQRVELYAQAFEDAQQKLRDADEAEAAKTEAEQRKIYESLLEQYETYQMAIERVNAKYDRDAEALRKGGASAEVLEQLEVQRKKALDSIENLFNPKDEDAQSTVDKWTDYAQAINTAKQAIDELGDAIGGVQGQMIKTVGGSLSGLGSIFTVFKGGGLSSDNDSERAAAFTSLIGAAVQAVTGIVQGFKDAKEATEMATEAAHEYTRALEELERSEALEKFSTAFGVDAYGRILLQAQQGTAALAALKDLLSQFGSTKQELESMYTGNLVFKDGSKIVDDTIYADMRSAFQKAFWGGRIESISLSELYDENGNFDGDKLAKWYDTYGDHVTARNKTLIEDILAQWEVYKQAQEAMGDYLGSLFSDVASTIADKMVNAFVETGDALTDLTDVVQQYTKAMAKSIVESQLLGSIFNEELEDKIGNMLLSGDIEGAAGAFKDAVDAVDALAPTVNSWLSAVGVTGQWGSDAAGAKASALARASQDSIDELNGRFAAIQTHTFTMNENVKLILATNGVVADRLATIMEHTGNLEAMKVYLDRINSAVDQMNIKGVKILA